MSQHQSEQHQTQQHQTERDILAEIEEEVAHTLEEERPPPGGPAYQLLGALLAIVLGVTGAVLSYGYGLGSLSTPGPGLWPFAVSVGITILGAGLLLVGRDLQDSERFTRASMLPVIGVITFVLLAWLMPLIGFEIPSVALCIVWLRWLGGESWRMSIAVSVGTVAAFYLLFLYGLRIPLPHLI